MPTLDNVLIVLKHNFYKCSIVCTHHGCVEVDSSTGGPIGDASDTKNPTDFEEVRKFQGSVSRVEGYAVNCIPLFAVDLTSRTCKYDGFGCVYETIVIRSLWVWPWSTGCKIGSAKKEKS